MRERNGNEECYDSPQVSVISISTKVVLCQSCATNDMAESMSESEYTGGWETAE